MKVTLTRMDSDTEQIIVGGEIVGYVEYDVVYVYERGIARKIGTVSHRSEVAALVTTWKMKG